MQAAVYVESLLLPGILADWGNRVGEEYHPTLRGDQNRLYFVRQSVNPRGDSQLYADDARCILQRQ